MKSDSCRMARTRTVTGRWGHVTLLGMLVIVVALASVFLYNLWTTHVFCSEIEQLSSQVTSLRHKTDELKSVYMKLTNSTRDEISVPEILIQSSQNADEETATKTSTELMNSSSTNHLLNLSTISTDKISKMDRVVKKLKQEQTLSDAKISSKADSNDSRALFELVERLSNRTEQTQLVIDSLKSSLDNAYEGLSSLGRRLDEHIGQSHHPTISLESLCTTQREQCTVPSSRQGGYWKSCRTRSTALKHADMITLYQGCSFHPQSRFSEYQESLTLQESGGNVWCDCDVTFPGEEGDKQRSIAGDFKGDCYLTIIRCSSHLS